MACTAVALFRDEGFRHRYGSRDARHYRVCGCRPWDDAASCYPRSRLSSSGRFGGEPVQESGLLAVGVHRPPVLLWSMPVSRGAAESGTASARPLVRRERGSTGFLECVESFPSNDISVCSAGAISLLANGDSIFSSCGRQLENRARRAPLSQMAQHPYGLCSAAMLWSLSLAYFY